METGARLSGRGVSRGRLSEGRKKRLPEEGKL